MRLPLSLCLLMLLVTVTALLTVGTSADPAIDSEEQDFLHRLNEYRALNGLGPLVLNAQLDAAADWFSIDMATDNYFPPDHIDNENPPRNPTQRANAFGYVGGAGENIAAGTIRDTGKQAFNAWKNSPPHNANMLNPNYTVIGIARAFSANSKYSWYWTTDFGLTTDPGPPVPTPTGGATAPPTPTPTPPGPTATPVANSPIVNLQGCNAASLPANDDGSSPAVDIGFPMNFFGATYSTLYVNNNGNVTFDAALGTYTPLGLQGAAAKIIAPFWADVNTNNGGEVTYGKVTYEGKPAFCVNWHNVAYYVSFSNPDSGKRNNFQMLLVQRTDTGVGDFDIIMNFEKVQWDVGDLSGGSGGVCPDPVGSCSPARMGYSNGSDVSFEYPGSNQSGAFLNSSPSGLSKGSRDSLQNGRYIFAARNGAPPSGGTISGKVYALSEAPANAVANAGIQLCGPTGCVDTTTNSAGEFLFTNNGEADYQIRVFPPNTSNLQPNQFPSFHLANEGSVTGQVLILQPSVPPPADVTITSRFTSGNVPVVFWGEPLSLRTTGCPGATATFQVIKDGAIIKSGGMTEGPAGQYIGTVPILHPNHGQATVLITLGCASGPPQIKNFNIYIDPSGTVKTVDGDPIDGARVTLYRSDAAGGPFTIVPNGSAIMAPANRHNPDITDGEGHFGWDVIAGYYKVRAEKQGCVSPDDANQAYSETAVLQIPPAVFDLDIRLDCPLQHIAQGDMDCNTLLQGKDALLVIYYSLDYAQTGSEDCPEMGGATAGTAQTPFIFGDANCDGQIDVADAVAILRGAAGLPPAPALPAGCRAAGH